MVGVINPNETMTWEAQYAQARRYPYMLVPGQSPPAEGTGYSSSTSNTHNKSSFSGGAIAGTVVGGVAFVDMLLVLLVMLRRDRAYKRGLSSQAGRMERTAHWALFGSQGEGKSEQGLAAPSSVGGHGTCSSSSGVSPPAVPPLQNVRHWNWETATKQPPQEEIRQPSELEARSIVGGKPGGMYYGWR
ncbi:hypothetical protein CNMCM5793_003711 [Aspergillus hiratsukae]|uniref:Transmembrane protein n=1 Tax=Aspergillus hiratsukae TaxID=1194566 RepID=A0A8H6UG23_9EURO|nr:hypothetical protein CNMCM5793_003711 [Aspergillus hiratsukae]